MDHRPSRRLSDSPPPVYRDNRGEGSSQGRREMDPMRDYPSFAQRYGESLTNNSNSRTLTDRILDRFQALKDAHAIDDSARMSYNKARKIIDNSVKSKKMIGQQVKSSIERIQAIERNAKRTGTLTDEQRRDLQRLPDTLEHCLTSLETHKNKVVNEVELYKKIYDKHYQGAGLGNDAYMEDVHNLSREATDISDQHKEAVTLILNAQARCAYWLNQIPEEPHEAVTERL